MLRGQLCTMMWSYSYSAKPQMEINFVISEKEISQISRELPSSLGVRVSPEDVCLPQRKVYVGGGVVLL